MVRGWWTIAALPCALAFALFGCGSQSPGTTGAGGGTGKGAGSGTTGGKSGTEQPGGAKQPGTGAPEDGAPSGTTKGEEGSASKTDPAPDSGTGQAAGKQIVSPVSGKPINKDFYVDYDGKRIYLADEAEKRTFRRDPERYLQQMRQQGVTPEQAPAQQGGAAKEGGTDQGAGTGGASD